MWVLLRLRRSLRPHHILPSLMFKYFHAKLHKLYYFVYAQFVSRPEDYKHKQFCVEHMLFSLRITLETMLSCKRKPEVANFLRAFRNSYLHSHFSEVYFISFVSIVFHLSHFLSPFFASSQAAFLLLCARPVILFSGTR
jgi:hypothetical protein